MIVRISTEGQYELGEDSRSKIEELDDEVITACGASNEEQFHSAFKRLLELIRSEGKPLGEDQLVGSDLILPPPDVSLEEAREEFTGEGLIPG